MVNTLTPKQRSAIERSLRNPDLQPILFRKAVGIHWFSAFKDAGFINASDIPAPVPAKQEGYVSVPVWPITNYLVATSEELLAPENESYANEFLEFIRAATTYAKDHNFSNYRVWWQFSKIILKMPPHLINHDDANLFDYWLDDMYESGLVAENLGKNWLISLLDRDDEHSRVITMSLLEVLYKTKIIEKQFSTSNKNEVVLRFDSWHAKKITKEVAPKTGRVLGLAAVEMFQNRIEHIMEESNNDKWSSIWRPAIEDHKQNHSTDDAEDIIVEGYRDSLLAFIEEAPLAANEYVIRLLESPFETTRRIAIYAIDQRYQDLKAIVDCVIVADYFKSNFRHEMWHLLHNHYPQFLEGEKGRVLDTIADLFEVDEKGQRSAGATAYQQAIWLSAIKDYGDGIGERYRKCIDLIGGEPKHPDFSSYMSVGSVDHESPITKDELLSLDVKQLAKRLDSYQEPDRFGEPGIRGLVKALRQVVKAEPLRFHNQLHQFSQLDLAYVYEIIEAYGELWTEKAQLPWDELWGYLLEFCKVLVEQERFWSQENAQSRSSFVANRYWIVGGIGRLIESGTKSDDHAFPEKYLGTAEEVLLNLLGKEKGEEFKLECDAVSISINSPRGRCLEALINLTLRSCRLADKQRSGHSEVWKHFQPIYDVELGRSNIGEYEFATLVVNYLPNFLYMSKDWVMANLFNTFDRDNYQKWLCAMQGYAYVSRVYEEIYNFLKNNGHFGLALDDEHLKDKVNEKIIQNIAVAFLNDFELLDDETSLIHQLLARCKFSELSQLIWFLWTLRKDGDEKTKNKIFALWPRILVTIDTNTREGRRLASKLCYWTAFVDEVNDTNKPLILAVAPYAEESHNSYDLLRSIARISERQPSEAYDIWSRLLDAAQPDYPEEAIQTALANMVRAGNEGIRNVKEIVSQYLKHGNEDPSKLLRQIIGAEQTA